VGQPIRVVVADDDEMMRTVLSEVMAADPRFTVVGEAADGTDLLDVVAREDADVVLLDVRMPAGGETAARALQHRPPVVVAVSSETSPDTVASLLRVGVRGYLSKGRLGPQLPDLVARCVAGEIILAVPTGALAVRKLVETA
jgi:DNA-binding NarL/FixJ family response regulator